MVGTGSKEVLEGPVLPRDEECRLLRESCQSRSILLTPYVIHRLVRLAPSQEEAVETGELGKSQRNADPKERCSGGWEVHPQHAGTHCAGGCLLRPSIPRMAQRDPGSWEWIWALFTPEVLLAALEMSASSPAMLPPPHHPSPLARKDETRIL